MTRPTFRLRVLALLAALVAPALLRADAPSNVPQFCSFQTRKCTSCHGDIANECILLSLDMGETTPWTGSMPVHLKVRTSEASPSLSTPAQLKLVLGYTFMHLGPETPGGGSENAVTFSDEAGRSLEFRFESGSSVGVPRFVMGGDAQVRLQMVDAEGWATLSDPAFFDLYPGDGSVWRYVASPAAADFGALARYVNPRGAAYTWDDMGVAVLRDASGFLRQVATRTRLADIVVHSATHYTVTVYPLTEDPQTDPDTGLLVPPPHDPVRVLDVRRGTTDRELIVGYRKGTGDMRTYRYVAKNGDWELTNPSGLIDANELYFADDETGARRIHVWKDSDGTALRRMEANFVDKPWGWAMTNFVEGIPGDATRTTSWSYFESGPHQGLVQEQITPTGNRILYEYDAQNRVVRESMPLVEEETLYSYEPVDSSDPPLLCDTRPRCVVRKMQGIEIQRTYYVYGTNGVDVVERVGEQGADYGGRNVLRTIKTYYPVTGSVIDGLVQSVRHEDGTIDNYTYDLTDGVWTETVTHVHEQAPDIVPMRTTRSVRVYNALGQLVDSRTDLCTIGVEDLVPQADWTPIERIQYAYDVDGNEIRREDLAGRLWTAEWAGNCCGKVSETDWQGITTTYAYDAEGRVISESSLQPSPIDTVYLYDSLGNITESFTTNRTDALGLCKFKRSFNALGDLIEETDSLGNNSLIETSNGGRVILAFNDVGLTNYVERAPNGLLVKAYSTSKPDVEIAYFVSSNGNRFVSALRGDSEKTRIVTCKEIDMLNRLVDIYVEKQGVKYGRRQFEYDGLGHLKKDSRQELPTIEYDYNNGGDEWVAKTFHNGETWTKEETVIRYVVEHNALWRKFINSRTSSDTNTLPFVSTEQNQLTGLSLSNVSRRVFSSDGSPKRMHWTEYDPTNNTVQNNVCDESHIGQHMELYRYGLLISSVGEGGVINKYRYDGLNRIVESREGDRRVKQMEYASNGLISSVEYSDSGRVVFTYDQLGREIESVDEEGRSIHRNYDRYGNVAFYDGTSVPTWFEYDEFGNLLSLSTRQLEDGEPITNRWNYGANPGKATRRIYPDGSKTDYEYDLAGRMISKTSARGIVTRFHYDGWGNLLQKVYSDGTPEETYQYDGFGRMIVVSSGGMTTRRTYTAHGEIEKEILSGTINTEIEYHYDQYGRYLGYSLDGEEQATLVYDPQWGRIESMDGFVWNWATNDNLKTSLMYPTGQKCEWEYDSTNSRLAKVKNDDVSTYCYEYDMAGRIVAKNNKRFAYDEFSRLSHVWNEMGATTEYYSYDDAGNIIGSMLGAVTNAFVVDRMNRLISENGLPDSYDSDGNQTTLRTSTGVWHVEYNANNRPIQFTNGSDVVSMEYDWLGRRTAFICNGGRIEFVYLGDCCVQQFNRTTEEKMTIIWDPTEPKSTRPLSANVNGRRHYFMHDGEKNVVDLLDGDGKTVQRYDYSSFGLVSREKQFEELFGFVKPGFSSEIMDESLGLVYYNYRHLNPKSGKWTSRDPLGEYDAANLYGFCRNNPLTFWDSLGQVSETDCWNLVRDHEQDLVIKTLGDAITNNFCAVAQVRCECCSDPGLKGQTKFSDQRITLCYNNAPTIQHLRETFRHEAVHYYDACRKPPTSCEDLICTEIRAPHHSGQCDTWGTKRVIPESEDYCIKNSAFNSIVAAGDCGLNLELIRKIIENMFDQCKNTPLL